MRYLQLIADTARAVNLTITDDQCERLARYVDLVFKWQRISNLIGPSTPSEFITQHIADCLVVAPFVRGTRLADLGSGAGLPGVVLACICPELVIDLVEARGKRARFLQQVQIELALKVQVIEARIEAWLPAASPDTIVCRALSSLQDLVALTRRVHTSGARLLVMKGQDPAPEIAALVAPHLAIRSERLVVPGWQTRHLVIMDRTRA